MSVPESVEELLSLIRKSGMVEDTKLNAYLHRRQAGRGLPPDAREAADGMVADGLLTNFQAEQFMLGKWRGFTIGKFKLLERVGVGGMGQVFLCEHMFMKRRVAVKVLPPAKAEQPAALGRFYREARAAGSIEHPNIVRTHDIDQDGNLHFIVMEYVDGSDLLGIVKKFGPLNIARAVSYTKQVADGLQFAFEGGIIHRDIKPGNVLVDRHGVAKLLDMGLARFYMDQTDNLTVKYDDKIVLGTADYVAPEQVANSHNVDIRADIYALGASLYFLLAGHPAFPSGTVSQKLLWHRTKDPTPIRQIRPDVPEGLAAILEKMMQKDPAARYQTPAEVAVALERYLPSAVPLPPLEEMPALSAAALEGAEPSPENPAKSSPAPRFDVPEALAAELRPKPKPFATKQVPFGPAVASKDDDGGVAIATMPTVSLAPKARSVFAAPQGSPFAAAANDTPAPVATSQPPAPLPAMTQAPSYAPVSPFPGGFPVIAMPKADTSAKTRKGLFIGMMTASAIIACFLIGWKVMKPKPNPDIQSQTQKG